MRARSRIEKLEKIAVPEEITIVIINEILNDKGEVQKEERVTIKIRGKG